MPDEQKPLKIKETHDRVKESKPTWYKVMMNVSLVLIILGALMVIWSAGDESEWGGTNGPDTEEVREDDTENVEDSED